MKAASLIARFPSGWRSLVAGENVVEIKDAFKAVKAAGALTFGEECADLVIYFDTAGNLFRKFLATPATAKDRAAAREKLLAAMRAKEEAKADAAAKAEGSATAAAIAEKAVAVVAAEVATAAGVALPGAAPAAQSPASTPAPVNPDPVPVESSTDDSDPANRFGGTTPKKKK